MGMDIGLEHAKQREKQFHERHGHAHVCTHEIAKVAIAQAAGDSIGRSLVAEMQEQNTDNIMEALMMSSARARRHLVVRKLRIRAQDGIDDR
jgi:hypothetical protein